MGMASGDDFTRERLQIPGVEFRGNIVRRDVAFNMNADQRFSFA